MTFFATLYFLTAAVPLLDLSSRSPWVAAANKDTSRADPRSSFWDLPLITVENDQRMYDRPSPSPRWSQGSRRGTNIIQVRY
ncbi:hypothetical protein F5H01DRAFT_370711 [Linnemannia elongata]|nr:hypothetical protein F5H01DRAFT_370711 [Linnemannia elongata]